MLPNYKAFLDVLSHSEGTFDKGANGYNVLAGGVLFTSYADHPRIKTHLVGTSTITTAAGRYQILERTYDSYRKLLGLSDFSPASQDAIALQMLDEAKALDSLRAGDFDSAVLRSAHLWASLPGAGYGQRETQLPILRGWYIIGGGSFAPTQSAALA